MLAGVRGADVKYSYLWAEGGPDGKSQRLQPLYEVLELMPGPVFPMARQLCNALATDRAPEIFKIVPGHHAEQVTEATDWGDLPNAGSNFWHTNKDKPRKLTYTERLPQRQVQVQVRVGIDPYDAASPPSSAKDALRGRNGVLVALGQWIEERAKGRKTGLVDAMKVHPVFRLLAVRVADVAALSEGEAPASLAALAAVTSIATPRVGSRPLMDEQKAVAEKSAIAAIRQPERTQQGKVCWTAGQTCAAFLDAFDALQRTGMKQDAALGAIAQAWSTEGNSLEGSSLKKQLTGCRKKYPRNGDRKAA